MVDPTGKYKKLYSTLQAHLEELDQENLVRIKHTVDYCGMHFQFSLNPQPAGKRYPLRGSVQALDRLSHTIQTTTKTGKKVYARSDLSIPFPKDGQTLRQVASEKLCETIVSLFVKYKSTLSHSIGDKQNPRQSSLAALLLQFGPGFQNRSSITTEASKRQLHDVDRLADALLDLPLSSITHKRLSDALKPDISNTTKLRYLRSLDAFLCYVQIRSTLSESLIPCLHPMIEELSKRSKKHTISKQKRKQAANARHLPDRIEQELNREIEKNLLTDPRFLAVALIKGSHLDVKDLMQLHIGDLVRNEGNPKIVFVDLKREYAQSATQNYIFPLFPYEATMVNRYLDALAAKNPQRIEPDRFLLSDDADGTKPLSFRGFTSFVRLLLMHYQFGYAELLGKMDLSQKHGMSY